MEKEISLYSKRVVLEDKTVEAVITIKGKYIIRIETDPDISLIKKAVNYKDNIIIPGIIDVHCHGFLSWGAKTTDKNEIKGLSKALTSVGVTSTLLTVTGWKEHEFEMLNTLGEAIEDGVEGAKILGIHMEGPFYNPEKHNATPRNEVIPPSITLCEKYYKATKGHLRYMTLAPEMEGATEVIHWLNDHHIVAGGGHTLASDEQMQHGIKEGLKVAIHTGNAMRQIDRRDVGALGASLLDKDLYCEIICDFIHIDPRMLQIMFKVKGTTDRFLLISDSDNLSGLQPGYYHTYGKNVFVNDEGKMTLDDGTIFGSSKYVLYGMENLVSKLRLSLEQVSRMSSLIPARVLGIEQEYGSISVDKYADLVIIDDHFNPVETYVNGRSVYKSEDPVTLNPEFNRICQRLK